jgi:hypothetical protein
MTGEWLRQVRQGPLGMDPAQAMHEQVELAGVVADQADVQVKPLSQFLEKRKGRTT